MGLQAGHYELSNEVVTRQFEQRGSPYLAAISHIIGRAGVLGRSQDESAIQAFARTDLDSNDATGLLGAALSFGERSDFRTWAVGGVASEGVEQTHALTMLESRAGLRYDDKLTEADAALLFGPGSDWLVLGHLECAQGASPHPIVSGYHNGELSIYDPANASEDGPTRDSVSVEALAGSAAIQSTYGLVAVSQLFPSR